ncbi:MAG TPA: amino acid adenylation domain-containing protein, partial [Pyrinomonadaceae bacterium]
EPDNPAYNICTAIRLRGTLNLPALEQSLSEILRRHEMLRTTFGEVEGRAVQIVKPVRKLRLPVGELSSMTEQEQFALVQSNLSRENRRPFDLAVGPLLRTSLWRLGPHDHVMILAMHHIISDGWSMGLLIRELSEIYKGFAQGRPSGLRELPIQYADYAVWQRNWMQGAVLEEQLSYWKQQLQGAPPALALPTDRPRSQRRSYAGARASMQLSPALTEALHELGQREGVTPFMLLLSAFAVVSGRYSGQTDVCVGTPVANRNRAEVEGLIGFFVNTLVMRVELGGEVSFRQLLKRVREVALGAYAHQDISFAQLVEKLQPPREANCAPFFQVLINWQNLPRQEINLPGLTLTAFGNETGATQFDLGFDLAEDSNRIIGSLEYSTELFDASTINRLLRHFANTLEVMSQSLDQSITTFPFLVDAEKQLLLHEWNDSATAFNNEQLIHQLFESHAENTPDRVALVFDNQQLTYGELNRRANQLAHRLRRSGVGPDMIVGICVERSLEMIVGVLGVLKAGGAYLPLNADYPAERLAFMLQDAKVPVLLTLEEKRPNLPAHDTAVICLDSEWSTIDGEAETNPSHSGMPASLAYLIYTSGSTGKPKGIMIAHRSFVNAFLAWEQSYRLGDVTTHLQMANFSFDVFSGDFVRSLCSGGKLVLCRSDYLLDPEKLYELMCEQAVDCAEFVPAVVRVLMNHLEETRQSLHFMRVLAVGSDSWQLKEYYHLRDLCGPRTRLINSYGLTEATIDSSYFESSDPNTGADGPVPIGRAFANTHLYVVDSHLQCAAIGVLGELLIDGPGLARGHLDRPEMTAEYYIPNPFSTEPGARIYRTGDLGCYRPDGSVQLLGRLDNQVKLRSNRLELGEIEAALTEHPAIRQCVAAVRDDMHGEKRLIAYVVVDPNHDALQHLAPVGELATEQVSQWAEVFDELYREYDPEQKVAFYIKGWDSSYTGQRIPGHEVEEWMQQTVDRIRSLEPNRVLEIGCGTGLMLFRIAPHCEHYYATDISENALRVLRHQLDVWPSQLPVVTVQKDPAAVFDEVEPDSFDTVIMVSVAQYFPNVDYLLTLLQNAVDSVRPGGHIFLGDVRSLPLLNAFHASVQLHQAPVDLPLAELRYHVQTHQSREKQLVVDPDFFIALKQHLPKINGVSILLERGWSRNELSKFRYDVIIHVGPQQPSATEITWLDWQQQNVTVAKIRQLLMETHPPALGVAHVPNARVLADVRAAEFLANADRNQTVRDLRRVLREVEHAGVEPEEFWELGEQLPYQVEITWSDTSSDGSFDVVFRRQGTNGLGIRRQEKPHRPWKQLANDPLMGKFVNNLIPELRQFLRQKLPDYMVPNAFVMLESLPLTPNGKVDRRALPAPLVVSVEQPIGPERYQNETERELAQIWAQVLGVGQVDREQNFFELGGDSILCIQLVARARQRGYGVTARQVFEHPTIAELSGEVKQLGQVAAAVAEQVVGEVPLTPIQRWFFEQEFEQQDYWNQAVLLQTQGLRYGVLKQLLKELLEQHDALRMSYRQENRAWRQWNAGVGERSEAPLWIDLRSLPAAQQAQVQQQVCTALQGSLDLQAGKLVRLAVFERSDESQRLLLVVHHLVVDGVSWRILLEDMQRGYEELRDRGRVEWPARSSSFQQWARRLEEYARSTEWNAEQEYWSGAQWQGGGRLRVDHERGANTVGSARMVVVELGAEETRVLLQEVTGTYQMQVPEVLLTALARSLGKREGSERWVVELEGHGREELFAELEVTRTVGWFTSAYPVWVEVKRESEAGAALKGVKEQLRAVPGKGVGYGVLRYLGSSEQRAALEQLSPAEISFNYLGQFDQTMQQASLFQPVHESPGLVLGPAGHRTYLLEIDGGVNSGRLQLGWTYSENLHRRETIEELAQGFLEELRDLIAHCLASDPEVYVPSDFAEFGWSQSDVDDILVSIKREL